MRLISESCASPNPFSDSASSNFLRVSGSLQSERNSSSLVNKSGNSPNNRSATRHHVLDAIGLCLFFASQGAGKMLWPVLAGSVRLLMIAMGGWWLAASHAPAWSVFALAGAALAAYGIATVLAVYWVPWGRRGAGSSK